MTDQRAISLLSKCRMFSWRDRDHFRTYRLLMNSGIELDDWERHKLLGMLHYYRRQHGQCDCTECFTAKTQMAAPSQCSLFAGESQ